MNGTAPQRGGPPLPAGLQGHAQVPGTNAQVVPPNAPGALADQFAESPVPFDAHWPTTTTTTTTSTSVTTTTTAATLPDPSNSSNSATSPSPEWLQKLSEGHIRGDECFREAFGDQVSLLDDEGDTNTRFTQNPGKCPPHLRLAAEGLAATMQTRNGAAKDLANAAVELSAAETAVQSAKDQLELALAAAQRNGVPFGGARRQPLEAAITAATNWHAGVQETHAEEKLALEQIQRNLELMHADAIDLIQKGPGNGVPMGGPEAILLPEQGEGVVEPLDPALEAELIAAGIPPPQVEAPVGSYSLLSRAGVGAVITVAVSALTHRLRAAMLRAINAELFEEHKNLLNQENALWDELSALVPSDPDFHRVDAEIIAIKAARDQVGWPLQHDRETVISLQLLVGALVACVVMYLLIKHKRI